MRLLNTLSDPGDFKANLLLDGIFGAEIHIVDLEATFLQRYPWRQHLVLLPRRQR